MGGERLFKKPDQVWGQIPDEPQSQQTSFPGSRWTSSMMAFVRSSRLFSPVLCSPRKAIVRASSLLFVNTDIHLLSKTRGRRRKGKATDFSCHCKKSVFVKNFQKRHPPHPSNKVRKKMKEIKFKGKRKLKECQATCWRKRERGEEQTRGKVHITEGLQVWQGAFLSIWTEESKCQKEEDSAQDQPNARMRKNWWQMDRRQEKV